jgi:NADPH-dependent 2,4-dienoyl-CoA reductase/sulfur reductase-like enzyme/nitrite reductase/ring-hydroxylating ferredoxin subunit
MTDTKSSSLPDFRNGFPLRDLPDGSKVPGRVDTEDAILVRQGDAMYAVGAHCTHYHGPLAEGLVADSTVRCPWHHACFSLDTGEALHAPAFDPIACWRVEQVAGMVYVREKKPDAGQRRPLTSGQGVSSVVIVGGGAAGFAAAEMLRRKGYDGRLTMLSADDAAPCDRPNLSKDFLAGTAQDDWIPLRSPEFYTDNRIDLVLKSRVSSLDLKERHVQLEDGKTYAFDALLIATGAEPVRLTVPGASPSQTLYLRTFADSRAIVDRALSAKTVVVVGASFIGLEVAASLRSRGLAVHVAAPEDQPLVRIMGPEVGRFIRQLHEDHGVVFHLGNTVERVDGRSVRLKDQTVVDADFMVLGVGVRPAIEWVERVGITIDRGIAVNEYLETSAPGVFAAGDVARWPDPHTGERIRVEHWVVAERQGQVAARNILGRREQFDAVPFFWSQHYDVTINYVGHAEQWDRVDIDGSLDAGDFAASYVRGGRTLAVATVARDLLSLQTEFAMERQR